MGLLPAAAPQALPAEGESGARNSPSVINEGSSNN
jgi:hypothetical protein